MGKEPNDTQPELSDLQTPVLVEDDEMVVDNPHSFLNLVHFLTNPTPVIDPPFIHENYV
jgi:hypothetical protein